MGKKKEVSIRTDRRNRKKAVKIIIIRRHNYRNKKLNAEITTLSRHIGLLI